MTSSQSALFHVINLENSRKVRSTEVYIGFGSSNFNFDELMWKIAYLV